MTKPGIVVTLFLFACFGATCIVGGYFLGYEPPEYMEAKECREHVQAPLSGTRECPPCKKSRPIIFPKMNCPHTKCTDELEACREMLEGIKKWCDPNCQEYLEACDNELQELKYTPYPFRHPYFP